MSHLRSSVVANTLSHSPNCIVLGQPILDSVASKFRICFHSHLLQYAGPVGADCFIAQREQLGNLTNCLARSDQAHYLKFTIGKGVVRCCVRPLLKKRNELLSNYRTDILSSLDYLVDR